MPLISLCMIMKDEEDELPIVLASATGLADEVVIYDTGSADRSIALARELGATVIEGHWDSDFSRARNVALASCSGEWVLWLDADEAIHGDGLAFRARLRDEADADAYLVPIESIEGSGLSVRSAFHAARLFRREACHWRGRIHEQITRRNDDAYPVTKIASELRILHRGYTALKWDSKGLIERNLQIAERALEDPAVDHSLALFDFGRTLTETADPRAAIAPLREAATTTPLATVRRTALRNLFYVHLRCREFVEAATVLDELRSDLTDPTSSNVLLAKLQLWRGDYEACLETIEQLPFSTTDEDGFEFGRVAVAWVKAHALDALHRPGDAADALLDALRTHGQLDESLGALVGLLQKAGRGLGEIASTAREETMPVLCAMAARLPASAADELLRAFTARYPHRLEPLAAAESVAPRLDIARAMFWSQQLRRVGLTAHCPLVAIASNADLEPLFRLLTATAGFCSFHDQRLVEPAREAFAGDLGITREEATEQVRRLSPELARLLERPTVAVHVSRRGTRLEGYRDFAGATGLENSAPLDELPLEDGVVHELLAEDVLASASHDRALAILLEWARVLADGGLLTFEVPNFAAVASLVTSSPTKLRRLLYGGRRFGHHGEEDANADAWTPAELEHALPRLGFAVERIEASDSITVTARRARVESHSSAGAIRPVSVIVVGEAGRDNLLRRLRTLSDTDAGVDFETVVFLNEHDEETRSLRSALAGDVIFATSPSALDPCVALDEAARLARGATLVVLADGVQLSSGWLSRLIAPLTDATIGIAGAAVVDSRGLVVHAGFDLVGDATAPQLDAVPRAAYLRAELALEVDAEIDAVGPELFAIRSPTWRELGGLAPGWSVGESLIDLALRMREHGMRCVVSSNSSTLGERAAVRPPTDERLAWLWAGRADLRPPTKARISASSLMPSSTLIERIAHVMPVAAIPRSGGANLVGDFTDARVQPYLDTLTRAGIATSRLQWSSGAPKAVDDGEPLAFATTLLCIDGDQLVDYVGEVGLDSFRDRRTIVAWEWPLRDPPPNAAAEISMVSEIWVPSSFSEQALVGVSPRPVIRVPPRILASTNLTRRDARMPEGFVFAVIARLGRGRPGDVAVANPTAAISAFCAAFTPDAGPRLQVVLLGRRTREAAQSCLAAASGRRDVSIIETDEALVAEAAAVTSSCVVSLHRSSSFGPDLARAIAAGNPVVATAYGGPMDYLAPAWAELVPFSLARCGTDLHPLRATAAWAEPDQDAAVTTLRSVYSDHELARRRARSGQSAVARVCGPRSADAAMLRQLGIDRYAKPTARRRAAATRR